MLDEIIESGEWWIPSNPKNKIRGKLVFNQTKGATLELVEPLIEPHKTIYGLNPFGREISLIGCFPLSWAIPNTSYKIYANRLFLGAHFNNSKDAKFDSLHCRMSNLFDWLGQSGLKTDGELSNNMEIKYNTPDPISICISPELKIEIVFQLLRSFKLQGREIQLKQVAQVSFHPQNRKSIDEYLNLMHHFRDFLCLVTQESIFPQYINGINETTKGKLVGVYYQLDTPISTETNVYSSLIFFKDIEHKFETCIQNWYRKYEMLEPVCQLYFGAYFGRFVYLNFKFLCLVQALEAYHRRFTKNEDLPIDKYEERVKEILDITPIKYKNWLKYKLKYSNEPFLERRLNEIIDEFSTPLHILIPETDIFVQKVKDTRNYMTHYDRRLKEKAADGNELFVITEKLNMITEMCLMKELGFNVEEIQSLVLKKYQEKLKYYDN